MGLSCQEKLTLPGRSKEALSGSDLWVIFNSGSGYRKHLACSLHSSGRQTTVLAGAGESGPSS